MVSLDRIDTVVLRLNLAIEALNIDLFVLQGTAAATPAAPALTRNASIYEIGLANLFITKNTTAITQQRITDTRLDSDRCGVVASIIGDTNTSTYYAQIAADLADFKAVEEAAFAAWSSDTQNDMEAWIATEQAAFGAWFAGVQATLGNDTAGNLLNLINKYKAKNATVTLAVADWVAGSGVHTQTKSVPIVPANCALHAAPAWASREAYNDAECGVSAASAGSVTFTVTSVPMSELTIDAYAYLSGAWVTFSTDIPDGDTTTPVNDTNTWLRCAGINPSTEGNPTLAQVVASSTLCATLMSSANAVNYMIRSTTIQTAVLGSATARTALDNSSPVVNPALTANSQNGYVANASAAPADAYKATATSGSFWQYPGNPTSAYTSWVSLQLPAAVFPYKITVNARGNNSGTQKYVWQGSVNGVNWVNISAEVTTAGTVTTIMSTAGVYAYYRLFVTALTGQWVDPYSYYPGCLADHWVIYGKKREVA